MNKMSSSDKRLAKIAESVFIGSLFLGVVGLCLTENYVYINIAFIVMGTVCVCFNRVINIERVMKYNLNHVFFRIVAVVVGLSFIVVNLIALIKST